MNASERIDKQIATLADWRGVMLARLRELILEAEPNLVEEWKWNSPTWSDNGLLVSVGAFKNHVGVNFFQGTSLEDPRGLFNGGLDAKNSRSINIYEDDEISEPAFRELVRAAVAYNAGKWNA